MVVMVSTGGFRNISATETAKLFNKIDIWDIELSAGFYEENYKERISQLISSGNSLAFHNYYPRPKKDFVLNLGSQQNDILLKTRNHCKEAIKTASELKIPYYSIHAGFCIDPTPSSLGKNVGGFSVNSFSKVRSTFLNEIYKIAAFAKDYNVSLMIENNVTSENTFKKYEGKNILLMSDLEDTIDLIHNLPSNVGWLCDVAHLKVSATSFKFDPLDLIKKYSKFIKGYHLSDNDGLEDTNQPFNSKSWFMPYLKQVDYVSVEVYDKLDVIKDCWLEAKRNLS